jgi:hypothetical protein
MEELAMTQLMEERQGAVEELAKTPLTEDRRLMTGMSFVE